MLLSTLTLSENIQLMTMWTRTKRHQERFILDGWTRNDRLELLHADKKIKEVFKSLVAVVGDKAFFIRYGGANMIPTGETELKKITITLSIQEWEGE